MGEPAIAELQGLGPKSQAMLMVAGITTVGQLRRLGSVGAYAKVKATGANASLKSAFPQDQGLPSQQGSPNHCGHASHAVRKLVIRNQPLLNSTSMLTSNRLLATLVGISLAACAGTKTAETGVAQGVERTGLPFSSPECLAARLPPGEPFPASAIPAAASANRQSGVVAIRYDVLAGAAQNLQVVTSSPAGLYDSAALQHAAKYRAPHVLAVRGCVTVIDVKF